MSSTRDPELEAFKTKIDLREYAAAEGYVQDHKESWKGSDAMRHPSGDKIFIKLDKDEHYVYASVRDENDNGSIIDFVQRRMSGDRNLGKVRQALRPWIGGSGKMQASSLPSFKPLKPTAKDLIEVERQYRLMTDVKQHVYLEKERCIPGTVLTAARFAGCIRADRRGNAVFPHWNEEGLCGFEVKNKGFTGFSKGGEKGLWLSQREKTDKCCVICESAIDALSYAVLHPAPDIRYVSIGGQFNPKQPVLLARMLVRLPEGFEVVAATDNDDDGVKYAGVIRELVEQSGRADLHFTAHLPDSAKDWNEVLQSSQPSSPSYRPNWP